MDKSVVALYKAAFEVNLHDTKHRAAPCGRCPFQRGFSKVCGEVSKVARSHDRQSYHYLHGGRHRSVGSGLSLAMIVICSVWPKSSPISHWQV